MSDIVSFKNKFVDIDFTNIGKWVIQMEGKSILALLPRLNQDFQAACRYCLTCSGRIIVLGMGKSGHIGRKIAATLSSTGSPAMFIHAAEALHGDFGMITKSDVVLSISNSGETKEIIQLIPLIKRLGITLISLTGNPSSTLATQSDINLDISVEEEACSLGLAPTASTATTLAMGDALAIALLNAKGFSKEDFAFSHPGGSLGKKLLLKVEDLMVTGDRIPVIHEQATFKEALLEMTVKGLGMTAIINSENDYVGLFTDGDLRRMLDKNLFSPDAPIATLMTKGGITAEPDWLAQEALRTMELKKINGMFVLSPDKKIIGAFNVHDLLRAGIL
jgi:arabinose-5-phosphate isomerase